MSILWLSLSILGSCFFVWAVFVIATVASLKNLEVHTSSWHYRLHDLCYNFNIASKLPKGRCRYAWSIVLGAPVLIILVCVVGIVVALVAGTRFLLHWICAPLVLGKIPIYSIASAKYWEEASTPEECHMPMRSITPRPPHVYWMPALGAIGVVIEISRIVSERADMIESDIMMALFAVSFIVCIAILIIKKVPITKLWGEAFGKLCPNIKVVYDDDND